MNLRKLILVLLILSTPVISFAQEGELPPDSDIFDDAQLLNGYAEKYNEEPRDVVIAMIKDDTLNPYQTAAAVRVFKLKFSQKVAGRDRVLAEHDLIRRINRSNSAFVDAEIMHALCLLDRYKYFDAMVPALIIKLDHYNDTVNSIAYTGLQDIVLSSNKNSRREAKIVFNTLRKVFFLTRNSLAKADKNDPRLAQKLALLRWSIKVLGTQELKRLPKEIIHLL